MSKGARESQTPTQARGTVRLTQQLPARSGQSTADRLVSLQHSAGNQAVNSLLNSETSSRSANGSELTGSVEFRLPSADRQQESRHRDWQMLGPRKQAFALRASNGSLQALEKNVKNGKGQGSGLIDEQDGGSAGGGSGGGSPSPTPAKKAGVDSFTVKWTKNSEASATNARLRLDYNATFKKDAAHDPALAEFRQNVMTKVEITAGPHKGAKVDNSPMHDDNYSRADDTAGHTLSDTEFVSNDNPGIRTTLDPTDDINYSFTAEQMIIDTSQSNAVVAKRGPHTGTITGADPRAYGGVPKTLS